VWGVGCGVNLRRKGVKGVGDDGFVCDAAGCDFE
jgi:hypothetical protein